MKKFFDWIGDNPIKIVVVVLFAMILSRVLMTDPMDWIDCIAFVVLFLGLASLLFNRYLLVLALVFSLAVQPARAQEEPPQLNSWGAPVAITVVICGALYCVYRIGKFCQKNFSKDKKPETNEVYIAFGGAGDEYGGSWNHGSLGSCITRDGLLDPSSSDLEASPTTFALQVFVASPDSLVTTMAASTGMDSWQPWSSFQADVASHGLTVTGQNDGSQFFERNKQPVAAGEVPIRFDQATGAVVVGDGELIHIVIERSTDLEHWYPILHVQHQVGSRFEVLDTSIEDSAFYRATIQP